MKYLVNRLSDKFSSKVILIRRFEIHTFFLLINYMITLEIRHRGVMSLYAIEDKTAVVVVASYRIVSRNPVHFKALYGTLNDPETVQNCSLTDPGKYRPISAK